MWIHTAIFILVLLAAAAWKAGLLPKMESTGKKGRRLFVTAALAGNLLGLYLTLENGENRIFKEKRLEKEETGSYEAVLQVSVDGGDSETVRIQIPEKKSGEEREPEPQREISPKEKERQEFLAQIEALNEEKEDANYYYLPETWNGKRLEWSMPADTSGTLIAGLGFLAGLALLAAQTQEGQRILQKRQELLLQDYPALLMKFTLLVQAGMTARRAFQKIGADYQKKKSQKLSPAYEEILTVCHEMESGISEMEAYRRFGERCGQVKYKTFSTLLVQNLQKGSRQLSDMLERESLEAWEERKRKARVLGEAAATKLLVPMILMLLVVMAVIMIPAFLSFYG